MEASEDITCFASTGARPKDVIADVDGTLGPLLTRPLKTLQGQVLFTVAGSADLHDVARRMVSLCTVEHVHVMLASAALDGENALPAIRAAAAIAITSFLQHLRFDQPFVALAVT